jgi:hypothetical protein
MNDEELVMVLLPARTMMHMAGVPVWVERDTPILINPGNVVFLENSPYARLVEPKS